MVGLTGGIGSGKSVVATRLAALGAVIIDSDRIAREVVAPGTDGLREVAAGFGERVLREDGSLDREALGTVIFGDDAARARLEGIIHPRVRARSAQLAAEAAADAVVVNDVPLLVEVGLAPTYHLVIVVQTAPALRVERLVRDRGMTPEQAYQRIRAQTSDERRRAAADVLLVNDGDLDDLYVAIDTLWRDRLVPYGRNVRERRVATPVPATVPERAPVGVRQEVAGEPSGPARFARLAARLRHALRPAEPQIDYLGSSPVPGVDTEVIDVRLTIDRLSIAGPPAEGDRGADDGDHTGGDALAERLAAAGYPRWPGEGRDDDGGREDSGRMDGGRDDLDGGRDDDGRRDDLDGGRDDDGRRDGADRYGSADPGQPVNLYVRTAVPPGVGQ